MDVLKELGLTRVVFRGPVPSTQTIDWTPTIPEVATELNRLATRQEPVPVDAGECYIEEYEERWTPLRGFEVRVVLAGRG